MKKTFLALLIVVLMASVAVAAPFLTCDPQPKADHYILIFDGGDRIETPAPLMFDMSSITEGDHLVEVKAVNKWGESDPSPLEFTKELPAPPEGVGFTLE